jgi:hypothetical protein
MLPPRRLLLIVAGLAALLLVHACAVVGSSVVAAVLCAFALMIAGPVAILAWFGSLTDRDARRRAELLRRESDKSNALLWQHTLHEIEPVWPEAMASRSREREQGFKSMARGAVASVAAAFADWMREGRRIARPILGLYLTIVSTIGLGGCGVPPEAWGMVRPGMGTAELVSIAGGPDYVRSNGTNEVWQYCRDFYGRDEGRYARYYTTVLVSNQTVQDVRPYPVLSNAGCEDYYRANF